MSDGVKAAFSLIYRAGLFLIGLSIALRVAKILNILEQMK